MAESSWRHRWRWLFALLAAVALAWTIWLLWDSLPALRESLPKLQLRWLVFTLILNTVSGYLGFEAFRALFNWMCPATYGRPALAHLYFTGQLMKHIPGRIWGVAYQSGVGDRATLAEWISISVVYMALATAFALAVACTALGFMFRWTYGLLVFFVAATIYLFAWKPGPLTALLNLVRKLPLPAFTRLCDATQPFTDVDLRFKLHVAFWFVANWLIYLLAWAGYGMAWPNLSAANGVWLCAMYTIAWFVGYISIFSPSGIGVRELVFVLLAQDFPPDAVAGMVVLGRVVLMAVDVILGISFLYNRPTRCVDKV